jgi:hypothetical protein
MKCPKCGSPKIGTLDTRQTGDAETTRERYCFERGCDWRWKTEEMSSEEACRLRGALRLLQRMRAAIPSNQSQKIPTGREKQPKIPTRSEAPSAASSAGVK